MTIQDALERAKQLHKQRKEHARVLSAEIIGPSADDAVSLIAPRVDLRPEPTEERSRTALARVSFDDETCASNHVLTSDAQLSDARRAAAAYRLLRGRVLHKAKSGGWSCIGITSAGPGEGKTITALNLAISIAREKQREVYLLDLDMRNASVFARVGLTPAVPLSNFFSNDAAADDVLHETNIEQLVIAGNRENVGMASELLASNRLDQLLAHIRRRSKNPLIIIDLPPVLSTDEALVVAPRLDATFMVVAEGITRRDALAKALDLMADFPIAGLVLNRSTAAFGDDYYVY